MKSILFKDVKIVDVHSSHHGQKVDVLVEEGIITEIGQGLSEQAADHCLTGSYLSPGWIDMRVHLTVPGFEWKEDLSSLASAATAGGFTSILCMPNTLPPMDNAGLLNALEMRTAALSTRFLATGTLTQNAEGEHLAEMYDMHQAGALAFTDGINSLQSAGTLLRAMQYLKPFQALVIDSPLDKELARDSMVAEGKAATQIGLKGVPFLAETLMVDRNLQVLDYFPGRLHLGPLTTGEAVKRSVLARQEHEELSLETSALYLLLSEDAITGFNPSAKIWPPLRTELDRQALCQGIDNGNIQVISSSHHPQGIEEKKHDFVTAQLGASTIETAFAAAWTALEREGVALEKAVACFSSGPAQVLRLKNHCIEKGNKLDLTWFDPEIQWVPVAGNSHSKSRFNPLYGKPLQGKALATVVRGLLYQA